MVAEFDSSRCLFYHQVVSTKRPEGAAVFGFKRVLNRPDAIGASVDHKVDDQVAKLEDLTLFTRQKNEGLQTGRDHILKRDRTCSFCKVAGHLTNRCGKKPHRDSKCD